MEEQLSDHIRKAMEIFRQLTDEDIVVLNEEGRRRKNPLLEVYRYHAGEALDLLEALGLTPAARREDG
jgi:phage terminase small subunit